MSFRCSITKLQSDKGIGPLRITVQKRTRTYTKWIRDEDTREWHSIVCSEGWEIVKELSVSAEGADLWAGWSDAERELYLKRGIVSRKERREDHDDT